jgi:hypothetical protein
VQIGVEPYALQPGEADALDALEEDSRPGGVLASVHLGQLVPARTGRETWVGHPSWTPDFSERSGRASALLASELGAAEARALVRASGAGFILARCGEGRGLDRRLGPLVKRTRRFGCATLLER